MVKIDRPQGSIVTAPEARARKLELEKARRPSATAKRPISAAGDIVTISNRPDARQPPPPSSTPLGKGTKSADVKE